MSETKERKVVGRRVALALGIICIVLASCLAGAIVVLSSLNSQVSSLNGLLAATPVRVSEIVQNASACMNKEVVVEGNLTGPLVFVPENAPPWNYELSSNGTRIGVLWSREDVYESANVRVSGVVRQGRRAGGLLEPPPICYYIEAGRIDIL